MEQELPRKYWKRNSLAAVTSNGLIVTLVFCTRACRPSPVARRLFAVRRRSCRMLSLLEKHCTPVLKWALPNQNLATIAIRSGTRLLD
jgi:hypothetical protein